MGCAQGKSEQGELVDYQNVSPSNPSYPPPYIPQLMKRDVYDEEVNTSIQERIDQMPKGTTNNYPTLLKYLSAGATKDVHHATAIYLWMKCQDYQSSSLDLVRPGDTPQGYMKMIKDGTGDLTSFFTILCRRSEIPCVIIDGIGKNERYSIGTPEKNMNTKWTAVFVDEEWKLAHIDWSINGCMDENQNKDVAKGQGNDFYFFTNPDEFASIILPENFNWQLLNQPFSKSEFMSLPNIRPKFFSMDMIIVSPKVGTIRTQKGKIEIEISFPKKIMDKVRLKYDFHFKQELASKTQETDGAETEREIKVPSELQRYVFMIRKPSRFIFEINIPTSGKYLFDIYGKSAKETAESAENKEHGTKKLTRNPSDRLCQFRVISEREPDPDEVEPLPECPDMGWGPGPVCRELGLVPLTHFDSCIYIKPGDLREMRFKMTRKLNIQCQMTHNFLPLYTLVEQVESKIVQNEVHIQFKIPEPGQYALKIYSREAGTNDYREACIYLLRQQVQARFPEKHRDKMLRSRLEHHLVHHTSEKELKDALGVFECYNVPDHGEKKQTQVKLKQYWEIKKELNSAVKGRNPRVLHKWLERARNSKYEADLQEDIHKAEIVEENMMKLKGYLHPIARMDPVTILEIRGYKRPPPVVKDVMTSTYILLGEDRLYLEDWEQIQYLMGRLGQDSLQKRILGRDVHDVPGYVADEAETIICPYSLQKCRENKQFIHDIHQKDMKDTEREEDNLKLIGRETYRDTNPNQHIDQSTTQHGDQSKHSTSLDQSRLSTDSGSVSIKGESILSKDKEQESHPFEIQGTGDTVKSPRKFFMTPLKPIDSENDRPISYAGFKPYDP